MPEGFDFTTDAALDWEVEAIWAAIDQETLIFTRHPAKNSALTPSLSAMSLMPSAFPMRSPKTFPVELAHLASILTAPSAKCACRPRSAGKRGITVITVMAN
ncbi:hypothetical protein [Deinococcus rubellus]|uniref:hypothetical protein n=1 Tax=Deinococcus rubellus TaxID=1889240 RepID=UPI0031F14E0F